MSNTLKIIFEVEYEIKIFEVEYERKWEDPHPCTATLYLYLPADKGGALLPILRDDTKEVMHDTLTENWGHPIDNPFTSSDYSVVRYYFKTYKADNWTEIEEAIKKDIEEYTNILTEVKKKNENIVIENLVANKPDNKIVEKNI